MEKVVIHLLSSKEIKNNESKIISLLDKDRLDKARRYVKENDYLLSIGGSYLINKYTGPSILEYGEHGKPYKKGIMFSLSHSGEYVILATSSIEIGIDIERIKEFNPDLISFSFNKEEANLIKTNDDFFSSWVRKESLAKCIGIGLKGNIKDIPSRNGIFNYMGEVFSSKSIAYNGYMIGVCLKQDSPIEEIEIKEEVID